MVVMAADGSEDRVGVGLLVLAAVVHRVPTPVGSTVGIEGDALSLRQLGATCPLRSTGVDEARAGVTAAAA